MLEQCKAGNQEETKEYIEFVEKFKPKKTTDDCYTPDNIYDVVADYVAEYYHKDKSKFVRPFYPGGDYENYNYPYDCVVVDNPPFSIVTKIAKFYNARKIDYFIFAPGLTCFDIPAKIVCTNFNIVYDNGADVNTSFATNMDKYTVRSAPDLYNRLKKANDDNLKQVKKQLVNNAYPDNVVMSSMIHQYSKYGVEFYLTEKECAKARKLDCGKKLFGGGFLISEKAAESKAAAERKAAEMKQRCQLSLSEREKAIIAQLE
nr:MAG TPA: adenine-specific methyltransferase [Caudoviricetes sp.]